MSWNTDDIRSAFEQGNTGEYSHMLVGYDDFDRENYPIYVPRGEDPQSHRPSNGDRVDECYSYDLSWASQAAEHRAQHWDYEPKPEGQPELDPADSEVLGEAFDGITLREVQPGLLDGFSASEEHQRSAGALAAKSYYMLDEAEEEVPMDFASIRKRIERVLKNPLTQWARDTRELFATVDRLQFLIVEAHSQLSTSGSPSGQVFDVRQLLESSREEIEALLSEQRTEIQAAAELVVAQRSALLAEGWEQGAAAMRAYQIGEARAYDRGETEPSAEPRNPHGNSRS